MKKIIYLLFNFGVFFCYSQTHKAVYSFKVEANPITGETTTADEINPLAEDNAFYLYFDEVQSYYTSYNVENHQKDMSDAFAGSYSPLKYFYKKKAFQKNVDIDKLYSYTYINDVDWELTKETKDISGYTCIKANGLLKDVSNPSKSYKIEAWFAPEVAYPVGPAFYAGLPGIIVYLVYENYLIHKLESIKFNDNSLDINSIECKGELLSKEQYIEYLKS